VGAGDTSYKSGREQGANEMQQEVNERETFLIELGKLINKYSLASISGTPPLILAEYMIKSMRNYNEAKNKTRDWFKPGADKSLITRSINGTTNKG
jgi:hypothetical protein